MKLFLFGMYGLGADALGRMLQAGFEVAGLATKAGDDPGLTPLLEIARRRGIPVFTPAFPAEPGFLESIAGLRPDRIVIAGYNRRIPVEILRVPKEGAVNAHLSLLPEYRGPCPWKWTILHGRTRSGATIHEVTPEFDRGDILAQRELPVRDDDTGGTLFNRLSEIGVEILMETLLKLSNGGMVGRPQDESRASYFSAPRDSDARIRWRAGADRIRNLIRGLNPRPMAWTRLEGVRCRLLRASIGDPGVSAAPGTILDRSGNSLSVATGAGALEIEEWRFEGDPRLVQKGATFEEPPVAERLRT